MKKLNLEGIIPATIVPMRKDYSVDWDAFSRYVDWVVSNDPVGLAVNVDTGEGPYLTPDERAQVIRTAKAQSNGAAIIAGVGGPGTLNAITNAKAAADAGADALLVFPSPAFLNDPLDASVLVNYHRAVADASGLPLVVFQLGPVFGGVNYPPEALAELLKLPEIIALKDASFDAQRFVLTRDVVRAADHPITLLTGNDPFLLESLLLGATGGLLGYAAVGVGLMRDLIAAVHNQEFERAAEMQEQVQGFCDYIYARPYGNYRARCKVALVHMGLLTADVTYVRPPFQSLWETESQAAQRAVEKAGLTRVGERVLA